jgi:Ca2+-binding EF-hand superfamily protein
MNNRTPNYLETDFLESFTAETRRTFKRLIDLLFESEVQAESLRQKLNRRPLFSIHDAFSAIDRDENGFITLDEFRSILEDYGIIATTNDLIGLVRRYDKNLDGRVSYSDFLNEMTPKSPTKY